MSLLGQIKSAESLVGSLVQQEFEEVRWKNAEEAAEQQRLRLGHRKLDKLWILFSCWYFHDLSTLNDTSWRGDEKLPLNATRRDETSDGPKNI